MSKVIQTQQGLVQGVPYEGYTLFKGIPYAKAPVGDLRWRRPEPAEPWDGVFQADHFGNRCWQKGWDESDGNPFGAFFVREFYSDPAFSTPMSEDCLNLNIWMPDHQEGEKLPVAFYIHGGGYGGGWNCEQEFDGAAYAKRRIILVTINYRLGAFGFLAHPWLDEENDEHVSGNYGTFDQIFALKWVYDNIAAFGGDPEKITIFGQSAGSMSVQTLISTELTGDMIHGAILQSGLSCNKPLFSNPTLAEAEKAGGIFAEKAGAHSIEELRALSPEQILKYWQKTTASLNVSEIPFSPNVDGYLLKEKVGDLVHHGKIKKIPYMLGSTANDIFTDAKAVKKGDLGPLYDECKDFADTIGKTVGVDSYVYYFTRSLPGEAPDWGAFHSCELWYTFGTLDRCWRPLEQHDRDLCAEILDDWESFIKTGKPADPEWKAYDREKNNLKIYS